MRISNIAIYLLLTLCLLGCDKAPPAFKMTVDKVNKFNGLLLKGLAVSGTVEVGCISEGVALVIYREDEKILEEAARILSVSNDGNPKPPNGEALEKEFVTFYLPGVEEQKVMPGDVITSSVVSCRKTSLVKLR